MRRTKFAVKKVQSKFLILEILEYAKNRPKRAYRGIFPSYKEAFEFCRKQIMQKVKKEANNLTELRRGLQVH